MEGFLEEGTVSIGIDGYDGLMDKECIDVCNALNKLPDVETQESCCGHYKYPYRIWFKCINPYSLGVIARVFDRRYSGTNVMYHIKIQTKDTGTCPMYSYMIESDTLYKTKEDLNEDIKVILENIEYWSSEHYKDYFKKGEIV